MKTLLRTLTLPALLLTPPGSDAADQIVIHRSMDVTEFVQLQRLSEAAMRTKFQLPDSCNPSLSAVRGTSARMQVLIVCEPERAARLRSWTERTRSNGELP